MNDFIAFGLNDEPPKAGVVVMARLRDGTLTVPTRAEDLDWTIENVGGDIVAYMFPEPVNVSPQEAAKYIKADDIQHGGSHYKDMAVQPWHVMEAVLTREEFIGFLKGNLIKYAMRQGKKDSPDADKWRHYKMKLEEVLRADA